MLTITGMTIGLFMVLWKYRGLTSEIPRLNLGKSLPNRSQSEEIRNIGKCKKTKRQGRYRLAAFYAFF